MPKRTQQVAALPWRQGENGIEILLVTTRTTKRWVTPKGWTMVGKADHEAAAIEAFEEAGVRGIVDPKSIGQYGYFKLLRDEKTRFVDVQVYALRVEEVLADWPERLERERQWVDKSQALTMIGEPELLEVIAAFQGRISGVSSKQQPHSSLFDRFMNWCSRFLLSQK